MLKKGILLGVLCSTILFLVACPPPPEPKPSIFGSWSADSMTTDGFTETDLFLTFYEDGTFTELIHVGDAPWMAVGTFTPVTAPTDTTLTLTITNLIGQNAPPTLPITAYLMYSNLTDTTVDLQGDGDPPDGFDDDPVTFSRETTPDPAKIFGTCACEEMIADGMTMDDVFLTMNEDGHFSIVMYTTDFGYQTGTFSPADAPADTTITFHVEFSSGPNQPPEDTEYFLRYSNPTEHSADVELDPLPDLDWDGPFDCIR